MSDLRPRDRRPIPTAIWGLLALIVIGLFALVMWLLNPPEPGMAPTTPEVVVPSDPTPEPPDARPMSTP